MMGSRKGRHRAMRLFPPHFVRWRPDGMFFRSPRRDWNCHRGG